MYLVGRVERSLKKDLTTSCTITTVCPTLDFLPSSQIWVFLNFPVLCQGVLEKEIYCTSAHAYFVYSDKMKFDFWIAFIITLPSNQVWFWFSQHWIWFWFWLLNSIYKYDSVKIKIDFDFDTVRIKLDFDFDSVQIKLDLILILIIE